VIIDPLNDAECLGKLTAVASEGTASPDVKALAARFATTRKLAKWIRTLPQRDDTGQSDDGPRVMCDVGQRARIVAPDPNCVERAILYLAAAELIDPGPMRQLATIDVSEAMRHTFPLENGEPVVLDPALRRNALRAHVWSLRNAASADETEAEIGGPIDAEPILAWLLDLAEDAAEEEAGGRGVRRVRRARQALAALLEGERIHPRDRADVLYALRLAGEVAPWFGEAGLHGYGAARGLVARVVARQTVGAGSLRNVSTERAIYWGGKAVATFYGVGGLYDAAYAEVKRRPNERPHEPPSAPATSAPPVVARPVEARAERTEAPPAPVLGTLGELEPKKGVQG
jgi:hypothetical protein